MGFFHADPHPGNVFILEDGALGLIDFGAVGRLDPIQREAVVDLMAGLVRGDIGLIRDAIERVADMDEDVPPELLERAIARVLAETLRPGGQTDPKALQQLVLMLAQFGIRLPGDLVLLSRALVTLDGTLGALSPGLTIASAVAEVSASTDGRPVLDQKAMVRDALLTTLPRLRRLPDRIDRIVTLAARGDLRVRSVLDEDGKRVLRTLVNRALLAGIGAAFLVVGAVLLGSADTGPVLSGGTSLIDIFGYGGLLTGTVLLLRVVAAVARDGTT